MTSLSCKLLLARIYIDGSMKIVLWPVETQFQNFDNKFKTLEYIAVHGFDEIYLKRHLRHIW